MSLLVYKDTMNKLGFNLMFVATVKTSDEKAVCLKLCHLKVTCVREVKRYFLECPHNVIYG